MPDAEAVSRALQIVVIDLLLSGDNALVIGMAAYRLLYIEPREWGAICAAAPSPACVPVPLQPAPGVQVLAVLDRICVSPSLESAPPL